MSEPRHKGISPVSHRDLAPTKRIGFPANSLRVAGYPSIQGHAIAAGGRGASHRKHRQHRYYDSNNHPLDTHDGLPDIGPEMDWNQNAERTINLF